MPLFNDANLLTFVSTQLNCLMLLTNLYFPPSCNTSAR